MKKTKTWDRLLGRLKGAGRNGLPATGMKRIAGALFASVCLLLGGCNEEGYDPDAEPSLMITPMTDSIGFGAAATEVFTFKIQTNQPLWLVTSDKDWCKVNMDTEAKTFTVTALPNDATTPPEPATVTVSAGKATRIMIRVTQAAAVPDAEPTLSISPELKDIVFSPEGTENFTFTVTTNQTSWTALSDQDWCKVAMDTVAGSFTVTSQIHGGTTAPDPATVTVSAGKAVPLTIDVTQQAGSYDVYLAGVYTLEGARESVCYWKNGVRTALSDGTKYAVGTMITEADGSVYMSWWDDAVTYCWKDGQKVPVEEYMDTPLSLAVENESVYLLDYEKYWNDGTIVELSIPDFTAKAIAVSNGTVHIAGQLSMYGSGGTGYMAYVWKDGTTTPLTLPVQSNNSDAVCATSANGSVYIGGYYMTEGDEIVQYPCYWKDNVCTTLDPPQGLTVNYAVVDAICVEGGKIYTAGNYDDGEPHPCYWENQTCYKLDLPAGGHDGHVLGIDVIDGNVYVAGYYWDDNGMHNGYWKNGEWNEIEANSGLESMHLTGIAVVGK